MPEVSKSSMEAFVLSIRWQIGSVRSTRRSNIDCKPDRESCLKRVNLEESGTTSKPQKSRNYAGSGVSQTPKKIKYWKGENGLNMKRIPFRFNRKGKRKFILWLNIILLILFVIFTYVLYKKEGNKKRLDTWLGGYYYSAKSDEGWREHEISIFKINKNYYAEIICSCDLRMEIRLLGYVKENENSIDIFLKDILAGNNPDKDGRYKKDELLIVLPYTDMELHTS